MDREKLFKLIGLVADITAIGEGKDGFPYALATISNYGPDVRFEMMDDGFRNGAPYDGCYTFSLTESISDRMYNTCLKHLEEMKEKAERFFNQGEEDDPRI